MSYLSSKIKALLYIFGPKYKKSYSQCGEDLLIAYAFKRLGINRPTYLDIGANHPVILSNTYLFYKNGSSGIAVEPNPVLARLFAKKRPNDRVVRAGVATQNGEADYFMFKNHVFNTFSETEANSVGAKGRVRLGKIRLPVLTVMDIIKTENVKKIDLLTIDIEGLDEEILRSVDFSTVHPAIICAEHKKTASTGTDLESYLIAQGYDLLEKTIVNSIYIDRKIWKEASLNDQ